MKACAILAIASIALSAAFPARAGAATGDPQLVLAAKAGDTKGALVLLERHAGANASESDGTTALHWAVRNDDAVLIDRLIRAGADVNTANRYGVTPIKLACVNGSARAVERLLDAGVSANAAGPFGETALMTCAHTGRVEPVKVLLARGATIDAPETWRGQTALMWATAQGHLDMMRLLIEAGANVNAASTVVKWPRQFTMEPREKWLPPAGLTPLLFAARQGCLECAKILLGAGADVNAPDPDQISPLIAALINGHYDLAAHFIRNGADVNAPDKTGRTALYAAVDFSTMPASARPAPKTIGDQLTAFDLVTLLIDRGAAVDVPLKQQAQLRTKIDRGGDGVLGAGTTPLIRAAKSADVKVMQILLDKGANPNAATRAGVSVVMMLTGLASKEDDMTGRTKTEPQVIQGIELLAKAGADLSALDGQGRTAVHGAALWGYTEAIRVLARHGARLDVKDKRGWTPIDTALGRAGGLGFDGSVGPRNEETARVIQDLLGRAKASAGSYPRAGSAGV